MIRALLTPEAHRDPYIWSVVLLAHAALGVAGWAFIGWWAVPSYFAFEAYQAWASRRVYAWDSVLDACGFTCGALLASSLLAQNLPMSASAVIYCASICASGAWSRGRH